LQAKLTAVKNKIGLGSKSGAGNDQRTALMARLDAIREQQSSNKNSRNKIREKLKALQDNIQKKNEELQSSRSKAPFKTVAEIDAHIKNLEKQVDSGNMKVADEKRALLEISQCKRNRRIVEGLATHQNSIEADRAAADELRKQLDDPVARAISEEFESVKAQLEGLNKERDGVYASRSKLVEERDSLQDQLNMLFNQKRQSAQNFREANDRYWTKVNEDRARRAERQRAQRAAEEASKKQEIADGIRDEAATPAYQAKIEDCQTLIDYFSGKNAGIASSTTLTTKVDVVGVPKLEIRTVDGVPDGFVARKKKGEDDDLYFAGKSKAKGRKGPTKAPESPDASATTGTALNVPLPTLSALLSLSIPPPLSTVDVPRAIEDLKTKKAWFEANQARATEENMLKAEEKIKQLMAKSADGEGENPEPPNVIAESPNEQT